MTEQTSAIVTGAAAGIGRAIATRLAHHGWSVLAADINLKTLDHWAGALPGVSTIRADVASPSDNQAMVDAAVARYGRLDAIVLNAGVMAASSITDMTEASLNKHLDVNLKGLFYGFRASIPALLHSPHPAALVIASVNGLGGDTMMSEYSASKFGAVGLVKSLARELGPKSIRVNAVCPGAIRTELSIPIERDNPDLFAKIASVVPLRRWAEPDEIAAAAEFLVSPAASYINGVALPVDGGASAGNGLYPPADPSAS
ncbi:SDR family NAD(P)-dependent oxidoreductase [Nocardia jiangxiensis]|uniref:SDR family NAD(P)-dependent oxidoreductase n=1 Tax=Nocardia jiangxiensis TaxID=282685 RepID=UPI0005943AAA|nr:SDR family oxidoreductase [Nocardia jiangxiensis]